MRTSTLIRGTLVAALLAATLQCIPGGTASAGTPVREDPLGEAGGPEGAAIAPALITISSDPGDPVGDGLDGRFTEADGVFAVSTLSDSTAKVTFVGSGHSFEYFFQSPWNRALREGVFTGARRTFVNQFNEPGLHVKLDNRLCDMDSAAFHVRHLRFDASGRVASLWIVFQQRCRAASTVLSGEVRLAADTSVYVEAPAEVARYVNAPVTFPVRAVDTRGRHVILQAVALPPGATFTPSGDALGMLSLASASPPGSVEPVTFVATSDDGAADTVVTYVRTFARAFLRMSSEPGDYLGLGKTYDLGPTSGTFTIVRSGAALRVQWIGRHETWAIQIGVPYGRPPAIGAYGEGLTPSDQSPSKPEIGVATTGRGCGSTGRFEIRKIAIGPDDRVESLWMTFDVACASAWPSPGLSGEAWFDADTSYYVHSPADFYADAGQPVSFDIRAEGALASDVTWALVSAPPGGALSTLPDRVARFDWSGSTVPGDYPVTVRADGMAGSETVTTWVHVPEPSFFSFHSAPSGAFPQGFDRKFLDRDGTLRYWRNPDNSISVRFEGSRQRFVLDFSRGDHSLIVPGDYPVTGSIPPWGNSPNGLYVVLGYTEPTLSAGGFHVNEATYDDTGELQSLWLTWERNMVNRPGTIGGEIYIPPPNAPPDCSAATAVADRLWPPDHTMALVSIVGVTDPDGDAVHVVATGITQDEPVNGSGDGNFCPDGAIADGAPAVRLERSGTGNGRVYAIHFVATDERGGSCEGIATLCVPHAEGGTCLDDGQSYNALGPCRMDPSIATEGRFFPLDLRFIGLESGVVTLEYTLPREQGVSLAAFDVAGRRVASLAGGREGPGPHRVSWRPGDLRGTVLFYRLRATDGTITRSVVHVPR